LLQLVPTIANTVQSKDGIGKKGSTYTKSAMGQAHRALIKSLSCLPQVRSWSV